jgi:hypothetical protein
LLSLGGRDWAAWRPGFWHSRSGIATVMAIVTIFNLFSLLRTPAPFIDEVWFANRAWGFTQTGLNFGTIDAGVWDRFDGYWTYFPWLPTLIHAFAFQVLGLSLLSLRLASLVFGMLVLLSVYVVADRLGGRRIALVSIVTVGLSRAFFYSAHLGRPDVIAAAFGWSALALYAADRSTRLSAMSVASGVAAGLAVEGHAYGLIYPTVIAGLYLLDHGVSLPRSGRFWGFALGSSVALAGHVGVHVLPYPETYMNISWLIALGSGPGRTPPLLSPDLAVWQQAVADMAAVFASYWNLRIPLVLGGLLALWAARGQADRKLLRICVLMLLAYLLLIRNKSGWYVILVAPAGDLLAAVFLERLWRLVTGMPPTLRRRWTSLLDRVVETVWSRPAGRIARALAVAGLVGGVTLPTLIRMVQSPLDDYETALDQVRAAIRPGSTVMGPATYWFGLTDEEYLSWEHLVYYRKFAPGSTVEDAVRAFNPDYIIVDTYIERFLRDTPRSSINALQITLPKSEMDRFLSERTHLRAMVENDTYGRVRIYEVDWRAD